MALKPTSSQPTSYCQCDFSFGSSTVKSDGDDGAEDLDMSVRYIGPSHDKCIACGLPRKP